MAQSATRELQPEALSAFMSLLQDVLEQQGSITLRAVKQFRAEAGLPATRIGETAFSTNRVSILRNLDPTLFLHAVTHELTHLKRGAPLVADVAAEETVVEDEAQTLLYGSPRPVRRERHLRLITGGAR